MGKVKEQLSTFFRRFNLRELLLFLLFVVLAAFIWYGHALSSVRSATLPVQIIYKDVPEAVIFTTPLPEVLYVEVRDAGKRLRAYKQDPLELTFDISNQIQGSNGTVTIAAEAIRNGVNSLLQGTTKVQAVTPEQISGEYYSQHSKTVPIRWAGTLNPAVQYQLVGKPMLMPREVTVYGNGTLVDTLTAVYTEPVQLTDVRDTTTFSVALRPIPDVRLAINEITVRAVAEQFTEKVIRLPLRVQNVPRGMHLRLFPAEVDAVLRVGLSHFNELSEQDVRVICNYPTTEMDKLPVTVVCKNPYVTHTRSVPASVEFLIEKNK
jgi:hypothetical protein